MRILVTGVAGFLGSHLADAMLEDGHSVIGVDNLISGERANIPSGVDFFEIDCNDLAALRSASTGCEIVYHCAATAYEGLSVFSPYLVIQNIVGASTAVFSAAISNGVRRIIHCSSMARYGALAPPFTEDQEPRPQDPYGIAKLASERLLENLASVHGVEYAVAVPHNIIGPRQKWDDPFRDVAAIMINLMLQGRQPIIYGDGSQRRCFSYVADCLSCLKAMAVSPAAAGQVINIGPDEGAVSILTLAETIAELIGFDLKPIFMPARPQEIERAVCSSAKARRLLGYRTTVDLRSALAATIDFIRERGTRPFAYHLPIEIVSEKTPRTWSQRIF